MRPSIRTISVLALGTLVTLPVDADGQFRRGRTDEAGPWAPIAIGAHAGYDQAARSEVLGVRMHFPILRSGRVELMPSAEMSFLDGAKDYQYSLEAVVLFGGQSGAVYVGGGWGIRDTVVNTTPELLERDILDAPSLLAGVRTGSGGASGRVQVILQVRWIHVQDVNFRPAPISGGVAIPLW